MKKFTAPLTPDEVDEIADCLFEGGIVLLPTDTVYGIAAFDGNSDALHRITSMKGRDPTKPIQLLAGSLEVIGGSGLRLPTRARKVANKFWPGALTLILDREYDEGTEGVRVPDNETACAICLAAGGMLRCTSANTSGQPPALDADMAVAAIPDADIIVDGGKVKGGIASTVVRITDTSIKYYRIGSISEADIAACLGI